MPTPHQDVTTAQKLNNAQAAATPAPGAAAKKGAGVQALQALLAKGKPNPKDVVKLFDANPSDRDAMMSLLQTTLGNSYVQQVTAAMHGLRASIPNKDLAAGDVGNPNADHFLANQNGVNFRADNGEFTGTVDTKGDADVKAEVGKNDAVEGQFDARAKTVDLGFDKGNQSVGQLYAHQNSFTVPGDSEVSTTDAGVRQTFKMGAGTGAVGVRQQWRNDAVGSTTNTGVDASYEDAKTYADAYVAKDEMSGRIIGGVSGKSQVNPTTSLSGEIDRGPYGTEGDVAVSHKLGPNDEIHGNLGFVDNDHVGTSATLAGGEHHTGPKVASDVDFTAGVGARDYLDIKGSAETGLANNLYGGVEGTYHEERGLDTRATAGASLTFTPSEKTALTLAGLFDEHGHLETRLELDVFKSKVDSVSTLSAQQKSALVSLFVEYSASGQPVGQVGDSTFEDRLGRPTLNGSSDGGRVMFGIRIKF